MIERRNKSGRRDGERERIGGVQRGEREDREEGEEGNRRGRDGEQNEREKERYK